MGRHMSILGLLYQRASTIKNPQTMTTDTDGEIKGLNSNDSLISAQEYIVKHSLSLLEYFKGHSLVIIFCTFPKRM